MNNKKYIGTGRCMNSDNYSANLTKGKLYKLYKNMNYPNSIFVTLIGNSGSVCQCFFSRFKMTKPKLKIL